jgi:hypothetical protein
MIALDYHGSIHVEADSILQKLRTGYKGLADTSLTYIHDSFGSMGKKC